MTGNCTEGLALAGPSRMEQRVKIRRRSGGEVRRREAVQPGERGDDSCHIGRLVAATAVRHRGEKRTVGFREEPVEWHAANSSSELRGLWKRDDAGQRNVEAQI